MTAAGPMRTWVIEAKEMAMTEVSDVDFIEAGTERATPRADPGHWLLGHPYGRDLLACKLRLEKPQLRFQHYCLSPEVYPHLEEMVDRLGLRGWPAPLPLKEKLWASCLLLRMIWALKMKHKPPVWRRPAA